MYNKIHNPLQFFNSIISVDDDDDDVEEEVGQGRLQILICFSVDDDDEEVEEEVGQGRLQIFPLKVSKDGTETRNIYFNKL